MTFTFNHKDKKYTEEEVTQRIDEGISTESDKSTRYCLWL